MRHKCFISFKKEDEGYKKEIQRWNEGNKIDMQDLVSVGSIGLIKAVDSYKLDKNIKLATYASRCIENEILMYFRSNKKYNE